MRMVSPRPASRSSGRWRTLQGPGGGAAGFTGIAGATAQTFTPTRLQVNRELRVVITYTDDQGTVETVKSPATSPVANSNDAPVVTGNLIADTTPTETQTLTALTGVISDGDGLPATGLAFQWQVATTTGPGASEFTNIAGATAQTFTPTPLQVNRELRVVVTYTDDQGTVETVTSPATTVVGDFFAANGAAQTLLGTEGQEIINGGGGADIISGFGENDIIDGGTGIDTIAAGAGNDTIAGGDGNDILNGDAGNDIFNYVIGDDADAVNGGADSDTLNIRGTGGANTLAVTFNGTALTSVAGGTLTGVETVTIDLLGGTDTLNYAGSAAAVTVDLGLGTASGFTTAADIENVTGGTGSDTLTGSGLANVLIGGAGADGLSAGAGADTLNGGDGNDTLNGGADNDTLNGGADDDLFVATIGDGNDAINGGGGIDTYDLSATTAGAVITIGSATSAQIGLDTLTSIANFVGSQGDDSITTNGGVNVIDGQGGNDTINAGASNDTVSGGAGNDVMNGGAGGDVLIGGGGTDTINTGSVNDNVADLIRFFAADEFGDIISNFDANGTAAQVDRLEFGGALNIRLRRWRRQ